MATVETAFKVHIAETGDAQSALLNGTLRIYNAAYALELATCLISAVTANGDGTLTLTVDADTVNAAVTNQTAALARIYNQAGTMLLGAFTVGVTGVSGDIRFDAVTGWNTGDSVDPGNITVSFTGLTVTVS